MAPGAVKVGGFSILMIFGRLPEPSGAIWMGPQKKQVELLENLAHVLDIPQKKIGWLHSLILLEGSQNKLQMFLFSFLGGAVCQTAPSKY